MMCGRKSMHWDVKESGGNIMQLKNYLQLFAEAAPTGNEQGTPPAGNEHQGNELQAPEGGDDGGEKPKYTDADVDRIISEKFAKWQTKQEKAIDEAKKLAEMNATQKLEYERDQLKSELDELKAANTKAQLQSTARKMLSEKNITASDEILAILTTGDAETTKKAVDSFAELFQKEVQNGIKEALKGNTPKTGNTGSGLTKEQILNIADRHERQKAINENRELFQ